MHPFFSSFYVTCINMFVSSGVTVVEWFGINDVTLAISGVSLAFGSYLVSYLTS